MSLFTVPLTIIYLVDKNKLDGYIGCFPAGYEKRHFSRFIVKNRSLNFKPCGPIKSIVSTGNFEQVIAQRER